MTSLERVLTSLRHEQPDRVPCYSRPMGEVLERFYAEQGTREVSFADHFGHDLRFVGVSIPTRPEGVSPRDWLPPISKEQVASCAGEINALHARGLATCSCYYMGVYEQMKDWYGDVTTLLMPFEDPARLEAELTRIADWKLAVYGACVQAGVDIAHFGDDLGTQNSLIMNPEHYRQFYRPQHRRVVQGLKRINPAVRVAFHCCGYVTSLIPDLIENVGIDILEAVQPECMDLPELKQRFGRDLAFAGAVGNQQILARGTPEGVKEGVRRTLEIMAPGGGYISAPCHMLTSDIPWENVLAFHEAVREYGG